MPDQPTFDEPWQAQAFAITLKLHHAGRFTWSEWTQYLSREIAADPAPQGQGDNSAYYRQWLAALEKLVADKGLVSPSALAERKNEWHRAHDRTPHGQPVELRRGR